MTNGAILPKKSENRKVGRGISREGGKDRTEEPEGKIKQREERECF